MHLDKTVRRTAVGLALALACSTPFGAHAASKTGQYAVKGIGIQKCADFLTAYEKRTQGAFVFAGWVDGYISAYNRAHADTFDAAPWQSVDVLLALIHSHCSKAPEERLFGVVHAMIEFFKDQTLTESSPTVETAAGDKKITLYKEVLRRAQQKLVEAGVYSGTPDGLFGPKTQAAFEAYQEKHKLPTSGLPDQQTLVDLFGLKPAE